MRVQSLLFGQKDWSVSAAKAWAKSHGYKSGTVDVTDQYIRIRQSDPNNFKVKKTITLGRGIRAVVAQEENMAAKRRKKASSRSRKRSASGKFAPAVVAPKKRRKKRAVREVAVVAAPRRRRARRAKRALPGGTMMEAKRRSRRRRSRRVSESWHGNPAGHRKAALKGAKRRKTRRYRSREATVVAAPRRRRRHHRRARESTMMESPRRRRAKRRHHSYEATESRRRRPSRRRRGRKLFEARRSGGAGMDAAQFAIAGVLGGIGFVAADALDRFLATYNPAADPAKLPKDKFTSAGAGTLANTLNLAASPHLMRIGASVGMAALPAVASMFVRNPMVRSGLEGFAIGSGVKLFSLLWNNLIVGHLLAPKDADQAALQKSHIARLYPAEVSAAISMKATPPPAQVPAGALSGAPDVGPFALNGSSPYPDTAQALRQQAYGMGGPSDYPSTVEALNQAAFGIGGVYDESATLAVGIDPAAVHAAVAAAIAAPGNVFHTLRQAMPSLPVQTLHAIEALVLRHLARMNGTQAAAAPQYNQQQYQYPYGHPYHGYNYTAGQYVHPNYATQYNHPAYRPVAPAYNHAAYGYRPAAPLASHQVWGRPAAPTGRLHDDPAAPADPNAPSAGDPNAPSAPPAGDPNAPPPPHGHHGHHGGHGGHHPGGHHAHFRGADGGPGNGPQGPQGVPVPAEQIALPPQGYAPGPGSNVGPGPQIGKSNDDCGCIGEDVQYLGLGFVNDDNKSEGMLLTT